MPGRTSTRNRLFVPDRLPETAQQELAGTSEPIGRILLAHGFDLARQALPEPEALGHPESAPTGPVDDGADEVIWARAYLLLLDDLPVFAIREWFYGSFSTRSIGPVWSDHQHRAGGRGSVGRSFIVVTLWRRRCVRRIESIEK